MAQAVPGSGETFDRIPFAWAGEGSRSLVFVRPRENDLEAFLVSTGVIALAEIGDKTQLLAFVLAARFRQAIPVILGILVATLVNHGFAGAFGAWINAHLPPDTLRVALGISFLAMAVWILIPDKVDEVDAKLARFGVFGTTLLAFFLAEMGDKTQVGTVALAARYDALATVVLGTTFGMLIANVPPVLLGGQLDFGRRARWIRAVAAGLFAVLGSATLLGYGNELGL